MQQTRISTANGAVTVDTGGDPGFGITLTDTSIETTSGEVKLLDGPVASGSGAGIALDADFLNAPDSLTQISTDSGKITISGAANGDTSGVRIGHAKLSSTSGDIEIRGESTQSWGVQMDSSASQIASGGASIHISSGSSISLGNGANITATGSDPTTLHIETDRSLSVGSSVQVAADSGPLTVQLEAGRNQGFGNISIQDGANISTRGGGVTIGSGAESELRLNGTNAAPIKIDTATNAGDHIGDVIIKSIWLTALSSTRRMRRSASVGRPTGLVVSVCCGASVGIAGIRKVKVEPP
jgi:hypothetical protein